MKSNIRKLGRLWPLLVIFFLAVLVLVFSILSIVTPNKNSSSEETDNSESIVLTSSPEISFAPASPEPTHDASVFPSSSIEVSVPPAVTSSPESVVPAEQPSSSPSLQYATNIDNTVVEFSAQYESADSGSNSYSNISALIIRKINSERNNNGLAGLYYDDSLYYPAMVRAQEMASSFSHTRPDGSECFTVFPEGYIFMGENLAEADNIISDEDFASGCVSFWMQSEGHRENILNSSYTHTAVGVFIDHGYMYAVQLFGTPY